MNDKLRRFLSLMLVFVMVMSIMPANAETIVTYTDPVDSPVATGETLVENPAAKIGDTEYATLTAAFQAAKDGDTIVLLRKVDEVVRLSVSDADSVPSITLDLNGKTWDCGYGTRINAVALKIENGTIGTNRRSDGFDGNVDVFYFGGHAVLPSQMELTGVTFYAELRVNNMAPSDEELGLLATVRSVGKAPNATEVIIQNGQFDVVTVQKAAYLTINGGWFSGIHAEEGATVVDNRGNGGSTDDSGTTDESTDVTKVKIVHVKTLEEHNYARTERGVTLTFVDCTPIAERDYMQFTVGASSTTFTVQRLEGEKWVNVEAESGTSTIKHTFTEPATVTFRLDWDNNGTFDRLIVLVKAAAKVENQGSAALEQAVKGDSATLDNATDGAQGFATLEEAIAAAQPGDTITLLADVSVASIDVTDVTIDLNGNTLTLTAGGSNFYGDSTIKNGTINITGCVAAGDCIIGIGDYSNSATLTMNNVNVTGDGYSSAYAVLYVYNSSTLNINGGSIVVSNDNASAGGVIKAEDGADGKINITGTESDPVELTFNNAQIGILDGTVVMDYVDLDITGGANAINQSALTVRNSTLTIKDCNGRALTLNDGDVTIENSTLDFSGATEGEIRFKKALTLKLVGDTDIVECDIWSDVAGAQVVTADGTAIPVTGTEKAPDSIKITDGNLPVCVAQVGDVQYETLAEALEAAKGEANIVVELLADATLDITAWQELAIGGEGTSAITINGNGKTLTFNKLNGDWNHIATNGAKLILNNMTITDSGKNDGPWNRYDIVFACPVELNGVTSTKALAFKAGAALNNVTINEVNDVYAIWIQPNGQNVTIDGLTVNSDGRGIKIDNQYVDNAGTVTLSVTDATFITEKKAAILVKSPAGANVTLSNVNIAGVAADSTNAVWNDADNGANYSLITVTGGTLAQEEVSAFAAVITAGDNVKGYYETLQDAVDAAEDGETIALLADISENVTVEQKPDVKITIDGKGKTLAGTITVDGKSARYENAALTIKDVNFSAPSISTDAFINLGAEGNNNTRYTSNVTISGCTFTETDGGNNYVGIKQYTGGCHNLKVTGCTATNLHSLIQLANVETGLEISNCTITGGKNGISLGNSNGAVISGCTIDATGYGIRADGDVAAATTVSGCTIKAELPIVVRKQTAAYELVVSGANELTAGNAEGYQVIFTNGDDGTYEAPTGAVTLTSGDELTVFPQDAYVAEINGKGYMDWASAYDAAVAGDTIKLLKDVLLTGKLTITKAGITIDGNGHAIKADETATWFTVSGKLNIKSYKTHLIGVNSDNVTLKNITLDCNSNAAGINIYCAQNVVFDNVDITNTSKGVAALTVNGSTLTVKSYLGTGMNAIAIDISNGSGVTSALGVTVEEGTIFNLADKTVKYTDPAVNNGMENAVYADGTQYFSAMDAAYYYTQTQIDGRTNAFSNGLKLLKDLELSKGCTVASTLDLNGYNLTIAEGKAVKVSSKLTVTGEGTVDGAFTLTAQSATLTGPEGLNVTTTVEGKVVDYADGEYTVADPVASITNESGVTYYASIQAAVDAAEAGETITVLRSHELADTLIVNKAVTLDLAGFTVSQSKECTGSYEMIRNTGSLTITGNGMISFTDTSDGDPDFGWGSYTINNRGTLVVENGTIEHKGGQAFATHMICAIQQGAGSTTINGGTISTPNYRSVRINGGSLTINGGTLDGQVWLQPNQGNVTMTVTGGHFSPNGGDGSSIFMTNSGVNYTVTAASIEGGTFATKIGCSDAEKLAGVISGGLFTETAKDKTNAALLKENYVFAEADEAGYYTVREAHYVAQIGEVKYETLADALTAAVDGDTIELLWAEGDAPIAMNGSVYGKSVTITGTAQVDWSKDWLFVGRGGEGDGKLTFSNATLTSTEASLNNGSYGIHVSMTEHGSSSKYDGTVVFENSNVQLSYLMNKNAVTVNGGNLTISYGFAVGARPVNETNGVQRTATMNVCGGAVVVVKNHNGMGVGYESNGILKVADATFTCSNLHVTLNGEVVLTDVGAVVTAPEGLNVTTDVVDYEVVYGDDSYTLVEKVYVAKIGEVKYETLDEAFTAAVDGDEVEILVAGTYALSTSGKNITITGAVDGVVFDNIGAKNMGGANVTFNNVTFDYYPNVNYTGLQHSGNLVYNDCTFNGQVFLYGANETFNGCIFNQNSADAYNVWTYGAKNVAFNDCEFNCAGKSVLVYNEGGPATNLTVNESTFVASGVVAGKAAIEIDTTSPNAAGGMDGTVIRINDTTATGFDKGSVSGETLWNDKKDQSNLEVWVDDDFVWPVPALPTATVTELDNVDLTFALNFKADEATQAQLNYYGDWYADFVLTVNKDATFNANGGADGYLSGQYDAWSENWVNVPFEDVTLKANESLKIMEYAAKLMGQPGLKLTYNDVYNFVKDFDCGVFFEDEYLAENYDLVVTLELRMYNPEDETENYVIGETYTFTPDAPELPTATVTELENEDLTFALNFKADEATDAQLWYYGDWYADFVLTVNKDATFNANGGADGYLSGQYDAWSENWVNVPFEDVTLKANESLKIMEYAAKLMGQPGLKLTYNDVYNFVKDFDCGVFFEDEYLAENYDLVVTLELRMYNPEDETENYVIGETYTFTPDAPELPTATVTELENAELTFALNFKADEATDAQLWYYGDWYADFVLTVNKDATFNANGGADGYLSGQYDAWSENWVNVPFEDVTLKANESLKIMEYAAKLMGQPGLKLTYNDVYNFVKDFDCGVFFTNEYLKNNQDLVVTLELRMYNPENEAESYVIGETYTFKPQALSADMTHSAYGFSATGEGEKYRERFAIDLYNVYARESLVVELYDEAGNLLATTSMRETDRDDGTAFDRPIKDSKTVNIVVAGRLAGSWDTEWVIAPSADKIPHTAKIYADGLLVDTYYPVFDAQDEAEYVALPGVAKVASVTDAEGKVTYYGAIADAIKAAKAGELVTIYAGNYTENVTVNKAITVVGETDEEGNNLVNITGKLSVSGQNATVKNLNVSNPSGNAGVISGGNILIEGCNLTGSNGLRNCYANNGDVTIKDCVITGGTYGVHFDAGSGEGEVIIDGSTITGWTSFGSAVEGVTITDTTFEDGNYDQLRFYQDATVTGCTFPETMSIDFGKNEVTANFNDCTVENASGVEDVVYLGDIVEMGVKVYVDGVLLVVEATVTNAADEKEYFLKLAEAIEAAQSGDTVTILTEGPHKLPGFSKDLTIEAAEGVAAAIDMPSAVNLRGSNVVFNGMTFNYTSNADYIGLHEVASETYNNCVINGQMFAYGNPANFTDCEFNQTSTGAYNIWTYGADNATFTNCDFNSAGKAMLIYNEGDCSPNVTVTGCTFTASEPVDGKAAIEIDTSLMKNGKTLITITDTTASGFAAGSVSGETLWNDKKDLTNLDVYVDGEHVWPIFVAQIGETQYTSLAKALEAAQDGDIIQVLKDHELPAALTVSKTVTIDLDGHEVTYSSDVAGEAMITNKGDLTLSGTGKINYTYTGAADTSYSKGNYTISNGGTLTVSGPSVVNSTAKMSHACYAIDNNSSGGAATLIVDAGEVINSNNYAIRQFVNGNANVVTINGGNVTGTRAVWMQLAGSDTSKAPVAELNVTGGTLTATGESADYKLAVYSYSYGNSLANTKINISGGTLDGDVALTGGKNKTVVETVTVTGGKINDLYSYASDELAVPAISLTGGTFNTNYAELYSLDDGYIFRPNAEGTYDVVEGTYVAAIGDVKFETLEAAVAAAQAGETVTLLDDVTLTEVVTIEQAITLNLGGKTLTGADGASVLNIKADTTIKNGTITGNKSGTTSGLIDIYADLTMDGVTVTTSKINALRFKAGECTATLTDCTVTGAFKGYGGSVWDIQSGTYMGASTSINDQLNGSAAISGGTFHYEIEETECAPGYTVVDNGDGTWTVKYAPACFIDANNNGVLDEGEAVYASLEPVFANHKEGDVYVVLTADIAAKTQVDTDVDAHYYFSTNVAGGAKMDFLFADDWNYVQKMTVGENITLTAPYLLAWTELNINGKVDTGYVYFMGADVTVAEGAELNVTTGEATVQVKSGANLTVNGTVNASTINVWVGEAKLTVSGANAKVDASWIDIWDGTPSVVVENGATLTADNMKASRGGTITVDAATLDVVVELGHNGESKGEMTILNDGTIAGANLTTLDSTVTGPEGLTTITTDIADHKVVYEEGVYKVAPKTYVAETLGVKYETLAEALEAAEGESNIVVNLLADATLDITAWDTLAIGGDATSTITINGNGNTLTFNKLNSDWNHVATNNGAKLILNNMTINDSGYNNGPWNRYDINFAGPVELNNVTSQKALAFKSSATLNNVTVNESGDNYAIWIQANGQTVSIDGLDVNSAGRGIKIDEQYVDAAVVNLTVKNADFDTAKKGAILVKSSVGANVTVENVDITGVAADTTNVVWNDEDAAVHYGKVKVEGGTKIQEGDFAVAIIKDAEVWAYYKTLPEAVEAVLDGESIELVADVELTEAYALPKSVTLETKGNTLTGELQLNAVELVLTSSDADLNVTTDIADHKVVYEDGMYKVVEKVYVAQIGEVKYETLDEAFTAAVDGDEVKILVAGTYALSTSGKNITITGAVDGVVFDNIGAKNMGGADVTFNNVTFDYYPNVNYTGLQHSGNLVYNDCTFEGQVFLYGANETFNGCIFNQNSADAYNVWTYGAKNVAFNECEFNCAGKSVLVYNEGGPATNLTVNDSTFVASASVAGKAAIEIDTTSPNAAGGMDGTVIKINDTTATGFDKGSVSGETLWNDKKNQTNLEVWVDGVQVWPIFVAQIGETKYTTLQAAADAAIDGDTIVLLKDIAEDVVVEQKPDVKITIDGGDKTIAGTITVNGKSARYATAGLTIQNVNFSADTISKDAFINLGAKSDNNTRYTSNVTISNCTFAADPRNEGIVAIKQYTGGCKNLTVDNCTVTGLHSLIQLKNVEEGLKITNCTITESKNGISIGNSINATISGCEMDVDGYGIRADGNIANKLTVSGCTIDAEMPIVVRKTTAAYELDISGANELTAGNAEGYQVIFTNDDDGTYVEPTGAFVYTADGANADLKVFPTYVAEIAGKGYMTLAAAVEDAEADDTITLLKDIALTEAIELTESVTLETKGNTLTGELQLNAVELTLTSSDATLNVTTNVADHKVVYEAGMYKVVEKVYVAQIGEVKYETLDEAFTAAVDGDEVKILVAGTYALTTSGKNITITGTVDGVVFDNIGKKNMGGADVIFNNVTFNYASNSTYKGLQHSGDLTYNNCTFNGQVFLYGTSETFNNCTFNTTDANNYNVWTYGAAEVQFTNCTFNSAGKSVLVYNEGACANHVTVTDSKFVASSSVDGKAAIEIDTTKMPAGTKVEINNTTDSGFAAGSVSGETLWNDKKNQTNLEVWVDDVQVWPIFVAQIGETKYTTLQAAADAAVDGDTIVLLKDIAEDVVVEQKPDVKITIDGGDKTIDGTITVNGKSARYATAGLTIQNVNFSADTISKDAFINLGAKSDNNTRYTSNVTISNCTFAADPRNEGIVAIKQYTGGCKNLTVDNCAVTGAHSLIQLKNVEEGLTITDCTITDSKNGISIGNSVGAEISGCTMNVNGYGIRADGNIANKLTVSECTIDAEMPIVVRKTTAAYELDISGTNELTAGNAEGYQVIFTNDDDGTYVEPTGAFVYTADGANADLKVFPTYVAEITGKGYMTLAAAVEDAEAGDTITLLKDIELTEAIELTESVTLETKDYTLNGELQLNAVELTLTSSDATLNVTTNVADHKVVYEDGMYKVVEKVYVAQIGDAKYESVQDALDEAAEATEKVTVELLTDATEDVTVNGKVDLAAGENTLTGEITVNAGAELSIVSGTFTDEDAKQYVAEGYAALDNDDDTWTVVEQIPVTVTIADAEMVYGNELPEFTYTTDPADAVVTVDTDAYMIVDENNNPVEITSAGTYYITATAEAEVPYTATVENGMLTVVEAVAKIGDIHYATLEEAVEAVKDGETIVLMADSEVSFEVSGNIGLDVNGNDYTGTVTLTTENATLEAAEGLNITTNVAGSGVLYENEVYKVVLMIKFATFQLEFASQNTLRMYFEVPAEVLAIEGVKAVVTEENNKVKPNQTVDTYTLSECTTDSKGRYYFDRAIASGEMTGDVKVEFFDGADNCIHVLDKDGVVKPYVIRRAVDYAQALVSNADLNPILSAMLTYGGYAQINFEVDTENLAYNTPGFAPMDISGVTAATINQVLAASGDSIGIQYSGQRVNMDAYVYMRTYFTLDAGASIDNYEFKLTYTEGGSEKTRTLTAKLNDDGRYYVDILNIPVAYWDYMYKITVTDNATGGTYEVTSSVLAWAQRVIESASQPEKAKNMAKAMYLYNQAANEYFGK